MWAPQLPVKEALLTEIEHFVLSINTGVQPLTSGESGLRVVKRWKALPRRSDGVATRSRSVRF